MRALGELDAYWRRRRGMRACTAGSRSIVHYSFRSVCLSEIVVGQSSKCGLALPGSPVLRSTGRWQPSGMAGWRALPESRLDA